MAVNTEPLRKRLEELGYGVQWRGTNQPISVTKGASTWSIPVGEYELKGDTAYTSPSTLSRITGYQPVRPYFENKGWDVGWDQSTGKYTVSHPVTGETRQQTPEALWGDKSYATSAQLGAIEKRLTPSYEDTYEKRLTPSYEDTYAQLTQQHADYVRNMQSNINQYMASINDYMKQYSDRAVAMLAAYQRQYQQALNTLSQWMEPQTEVPESIKVAIKILEDETAESRLQLENELARRGLGQSGYAGEMYAKLEKGLTTEKEKLLAQWIDESYRRAYDAALQAAGLQAQFAGGYGNVYQNAYLAPLQTLMQSAGQLYQMQSDLARTSYEYPAELLQWKSEQESAARTARSKAEQEAQKQALEWQKALLSAETWLSGQKQRYVNEAAEESAIADVLQAPSVDAALDYIEYNKDNLIGSGVRVSKLFEAINVKFNLPSVILQQYQE